jgi:hypothetical protein
LREQRLHVSLKGDVAPARISEIGRALTDVPLPHGVIQRLDA